MLFACASRFTTPCRQLLILLTIFSLYLSTATSANAATYYVATNGSDSNPGTLDRPWKTVKYAVSKMVAGDTTYVREGVYREKGVAFSTSGTASAPIKLLNYPGESPTLEGDQASHAGINLRRGVGWITIEGLEITRYNNGIVFDDAHDVIIRGNWIHHNTPAPNTPMTNSGSRHAQGIAGDAARILIDSNLINNNGNFHECSQNARHCNQDHGMYIHGTSFTITNNLIYGNLGYGIQIAAAYPYNPSIDASPEYAGATNWVIANNTIANQFDRAGIVVWGPVRNSSIENNIFYENAANRATNFPQGIDFYFPAGSPSGIVIRNNISYATGAGGTRFISAAATEGVHYTQSGNIVNTADPQFVNAAAGDFGLQASSPALNKGLSLAQVTTDFTGKARAGDAGYDIGAFEGAGSRADVLPGSSGGFPATTPPSGSTGGTGSTGGGSLGLGNCLK